MADETIEIGIVANTSGATKLKRALDDVASSESFLEKNTIKADAVINKFNNDLLKTDKSLVKTDKGVKGLTKSFGILKPLVAGIAFTTITKDLLGFDSALAETSTLLDGVGNDMKDLRSEAIRLSEAYGTSATDQVKAYYQAISAGAKGAAADLKVEAANRLAVAGVSDTQSSLTLLSAIGNVYGNTDNSDKDYSDTILTTVKDGVTTLTELKPALAQVIPVANQLGISFDEVGASFATITKQGVSTSIAGTQFKAFLTNIIKPSNEATKAAAEMGIQFDATALKTQGFAGFINTLSEATDGNTEKMAQLFGSVEGLNLALGLTSDQGLKSLNDSLDDMANKAGATDEAFDKIASSSAFKVQKLLSTISGEATRLSEVFVDKLGNAAEFVTKNFDTIEKVLLTAAGVWGTYKAAMLAATVTTGIIAATEAVLGLAKGIGVATTAMKLFNSTIKKNPFVAIGGFVASAAGSLLGFNNELKETNKQLDDLSKKKVGEASNTKTSQNISYISRDAYDSMISATNGGLLDLNNNLKETGEQLNNLGKKAYVSPLGGESQFAEKPANDNNLKPANDYLFALTDANKGFKESIDTGKKLNTVIEDNTKALDQQDRAVDMLSSSMTRTFADAITSGKSFSSVLSDLTNQLVNFALQLTVLNPLKSGISNLLNMGVSAFSGAPTGGSVLSSTAAQSMSYTSFNDYSSMMSSAPYAFATGGSVVLGGKGGVDQNLLSYNGQPLARVGRGETLSVTPANQNTTNNGNIVVNQTINIAGDPNGEKTVTAKQFAQAMAQQNKQLQQLANNVPALTKQANRRGY